MTGVLVADSATETNDVDAGLAEQAAVDVQQALIDDLARAAVGGDSAARDQIIAEVYPLVLRYCRRRLGRTDSVIGSADDVAQEVCLAVVAALRKYPISGRSFRSFVYGIGANKVADAFRAMGRNRTDPTTDVPDGAVLDDGPEQRLLAAERSERLAGLCRGGGAKPPSSSAVIPRRGSTATMTEPVQPHPEVALLALGDAGTSGTGPASRGRSLHLTTSRSPRYMRFSP